MRTVIILRGKRQDINLKCTAYLYICIKRSIRGIKNSFLYNFTFKVLHIEHILLLYFLFYISCYMFPLIKKQKLPILRNRK